MSIKKKDKKNNTEIKRVIIMLIYIEIIAISMAYIICNHLDYISVIARIFISLGIILLASIIYVGEIVRNGIKGVKTNES